MPNMTINVTGMSCGGCEKATENGLKKLPGISAVKADHIAKKVTIEYEGTQPDQSLLRETVAKLGYKMA